MLRLMMIQEVLIKLIKNQKGVAIIMVLTAITILMAIMGDFTFDTKINKIKSYNLQEKIQAQLNAEAGLRLALMRLRLYKEAFNYIENNQSVKEKIKMESVNAIWEVPFLFPIPILPNMLAKQKAAIGKFVKNSLLEGNVQTYVYNISNKINLNLLRVSAFLQTNKKTTNENEDNSSNNNTNSEGNVDAYKELSKLVSQTIENKSREDENFAEKYSGQNVDELISIIKFYISDPNSDYDDVYKTNAENVFLENKITAKHASMASASELYMLAGWSDELIKTLENEITVHSNVMIDLNKITDKVLRLIIPGIDDQDVKDFFEYRDSADDPHPFNSVKDFQNYVTNIGRFMSTADFDKRMQEFEKAGIKFGSAPTLFLITSIGEYNRSTVTIDAYVSMPARPQVQVTTTTTNPDDTEEPVEEPEEPEQNGTNNTTKKPKPQAALLLEPRIVEIIIR